jgi:hypothetical protein
MVQTVAPHNQQKPAHYRIQARLNRRAAAVLALRMIPLG